MSRRWWTLVAVSLATLMAYLDNNVVNVALPTIQRDLHLSVSGLEWVVSSYLLVFAGLLLAGGRLADHYGRRRIFLIGLGIFTASSLASGLAGDAAVLIASRAVQGLGAALMVPTTLAIILATFNDARERNIAVGIWNAIAALALAIGPLIAGLISQHLHWGWIFFINVPVGVVTAIIALPAMDESRGGADGEARRLDTARPGRVRGHAVLAGVRADRGPGPRLDVAGHPRRLRAGRRRPGRVPAGGAPGHPADGDAVDVPLPGVLRRHGDDDAVGLRRVRDLLLHRALPAGHPGLLADQGRARLRPHGAGGGRVLRAGRPDRRADPHGRGGGRWHAGHGGRPDPVRPARRQRELHRADPRLRGLRCRAPA